MGTQAPSAIPADHFVAFSCYHRRPLLSSAAAKRTFEVALDRVRRRFTLCVYGYVVMPEHVHLYDFNVRNERQFVEKLRYIQNNPVKRGLCKRAEDWE